MSSDTLDLPGTRCPFCGSIGLVYIHRYDQRDGLNKMVGKRCPDCGANEAEENDPMDNATDKEQRLRWYEFKTALNTVRKGD